MLLLGRMDLETLRRKRRIINLDTLLEKVVRRYVKRASARRIRLLCEPCEKVRIRAIPELIRMAADNLVDNALKYTPDGKESHIYIRLFRKKGRAVMEISDEGMGIKDEHMPYVFEPFYRGDDAHSRTVSGHGLGLSIVLWIVRLHKGGISLESTENGTTARVSFPLAD
jgi:two-component system sensor histidine kinase CiaH